MEDFIEVAANNRTVQVSARPVTMPEFQAFLDEQSRPVPEGVRRASSAEPAPNMRGEGQPVIGVTQVDAAAYCEWISKRVGHPCRLPSTDELDALMPHTTVDHAHEKVPDAGFWPHELGQLPELRGGLKPVYLCEWTRDIEEVATDAQPDRAMARIFYPPWLREGNNPVHVHAALLAHGSYSFVTFRISYGE